MKMSIQEVVKDCGALGVLMEAIYSIYALIIDPDVVLDNNIILLAFFIKLCFMTPTYIQM